MAAQVIGDSEELVLVRLRPLCERIVDGGMAVVTKRGLVNLIG